MKLLQQIGGLPSDFEVAVGKLFKALGRGIKRLFAGRCPACGRPLHEKREEPPSRWRPKRRDKV